MTFHRAGANPSIMLPLMIMLLVASVLAGTVALFFSTFMAPLFALAATSVVLGTSAMMTGLIGHRILPGLAFYPLLAAVTDFSFQTGASLPWIALLQGVLESALFLGAGSWIFSRRDVAVPVE
jgi:ABC-type transport system involved in multi-copper enzyme maturation permease subunit